MPFHLLGMLTAALCGHTAKVWKVWECEPNMNTMALLARVHRSVHAQHKGHPKDPTPEEIQWGWVTKDCT